MNILTHLSSGASRSVRLWKWILIIWSATLFIVAMLALPLKGEINGILGKSMITEKLTLGLNLDVLANSGTGLRIFLSSFSIGFILVVLFSVLINVFFNGGLFTVLRKANVNSGSAGFFGAASSNFWSFLLIALFVMLMISLVSFFLIGLPILLKMDSSSGSSSLLLKISAAIMLLILPVLLLVADYARAWQASSGKKNAFRAIGEGFKITFSNFFSSWLTMLIIVIAQAIFTVLAIVVTGTIRPASSGGIFLMFIMIQGLFIIRLFLRIWRYGSVSSMYEDHNSLSVQ